jgi:2-polyprenyl-3-methyl-5-hydroxy-6-metoxy-1,4-benzoquinol methylase
MKNVVPIFTVYNKVALLDKLITKQDTVLDVGFWGQGITSASTVWPHKMLQDRAADVFGIDLVYDEAIIPATARHKYQKTAAEHFEFDQKFDVIFAGDLIEHLVNPGLFLDNVKKHLKPGGRLIMTTPNTFNLFNLAGKLTRTEPVTNPDHTFYFNQTTLRVLLQKCGLQVDQFGYMYTLEYHLKESLKKKFLNSLYRALSWFTPKYNETLIVVASVPK